MSLFSNGDYDCLKELLRPAKLINSKDLNTLISEDLEERVYLWNEIKNNMKKFENGECGEFPKDIIQHSIADFVWAQLKLSASFAMNNEDVEGAVRKFTPKEIDVVKSIERLNSFDIKTVEDIIDEVRMDNRTTIEYLREYYLSMKGSYLNLLNDSEIKLPVRQAIKTKFKERFEKIEDAFARLSREGLLPKIVREVEKEVEEIEKEKLRELEEEKKRIEEEKAQIVKLAEEAIEDERKKIEEKEKELEIRKERLEEEIKERIEKLKQVEEGVSRRYVERDEARMLELNYFERLGKKLALPVELYLKGGFSVKAWEKEEYSDESEEIEKRFFGRLSAEELRRMPQNKSVMYKARKKKLFGKGEAVILEALFYSHLENLAELGFDTKEMSLSELTPILSEKIEKARKEDAYIVLGIVSPTGFEEKVKEYIAGEEFHKNFLSNRLAVCLVDAETGELLYNPVDEMAKHYKNFFEIEFNEEKVEKCKLFIKNKLSVEEYVVLEDVVKEGNFARDVAKKAFYEVEKEGFRIRYIKDVGLVLEK